MGRPLVPKRQRAEVVEKIREAEPFHRWEPEMVIRHFAYLLREGQRFTADDVKAVVQQLGLGDVEVGHTLSELKVLRQILEWDWRCRQVWEIPLQWFDLAIDRLRYYMPKIARVQHERLVAEFGGGPEPEQHGVSRRLRELTAQVIASEQRVFLEETYNCLQIDAHRAAIVMGRNLAYDHLRRWVFNHRLTEFNTELTTRYEKRNKLYDPVVKHDEFPDREWLVLDICEKARLIKGHEKDILFDSLKTRNRYAHPSSAVATPAIAAGYIENLLEHVVLNHDFAL